MKSKLVPIVDADIIVYRCGLADKEQTEPLSYTLNSVKSTLESILDNFEPSDRTRVLLQGRGNYRDRVATVLPYKGNRDPNARPQYYDEIREYLVSYKGAEIINGKETDDEVGTEQWGWKDRSTCIVSIDKDLDCVPGWHYNWVKNELYYVDLPTANKHYWAQVLTGDRTDNILGCGKQVEKVYKSGKKIGQAYVTRDGVGPKEAEEILAKTDGTWLEMHKAVFKEYQKIYGSDAARVFHENATLLWIQREHMINYNGEPIGKEEGREEDEESLSAERANEDTAVH